VVDRALAAELDAAREALRLAEDALTAERERTRRYLDAAETTVVVLDAGHRIAAVNRKGLQVSGRPEADLLGRGWADAMVPEPERTALRHRLDRLHEDGAADVELECAALTPGRAPRTMRWRLSAVRDDAGALVGSVVTGEDVTERRRTEQQVTYLAYHDALTGLPNRLLLEEHLNLALARARRSGAGVALLHIDLDGFKLVNDSLGHAGGDRLLCSLAMRLQQRTRATDLLARPGGDELLLLISDVHDESGGVVAVAERTAERIVAALQEPFAVNGAEFQVGCSIGISTHPRDARDAEELLDHADSAMYRAKAVARGGWAVYADGSEDALERLSLSTRLRRALAQDEFLLHYQPIFGTADGGFSELVGVEALLRWHDPERGMVPPGEFIPLAEETGLIEALGDWVVGAVCEQQVAWAEAGLRPQISFNVSPRQLRRLDFTDRVAAHLERTGADPRRLTVELTESATMEDPAEAEPILHDLHALGLRLALDDFGSGYSSLTRLREMPVETLKIDRGFLREVPANHEASAIVTAILRLSAALGRTTVAEGVETEAQQRFLVEQGCALAQGFLLARPMAAADILARFSAAPAA
jgi:diguanylate cyclase (GGDEF)-like protein/PAS domain S-box-containing protein